MRQDFSTTYEDFIGSIFQPCEMASYIGAVREQNGIEIFSLPNRKISLCVFSLCAKWVTVNLTLTQKILAQHEKNVGSSLFILGRMQWAKKPSHATVPLKGIFRTEIIKNLNHLGVDELYPRPTQWFQFHHYLIFLIWPKSPFNFFKTCFLWLTRSSVVR